MLFVPAPPPHQYPLCQIDKLHFGNFGDGWFLLNILGGLSCSLFTYLVPSLVFNETLSAELYYIVYAVRASTPLIAIGLA